MRPRFSVGFRAWCVALAVGAAPLARAAEQHPLQGATREQVIERYGEPRSTLTRGDLVLFFYPRERLTLRNGVVVEVERLASAEPARQQPTTPAETATPATAAPRASRPPASTDAAAPTSTEAPAPAPAQPETAAPGVAAESTPPPPAPPPESRVEIKRVLPRGATPPRPAPKEQPPAAPTASAAKQPASSAPSQSQPATAQRPPSAATSEATTGGPATAPVPVATAPSAEQTTTPSPAPDATTTEEPAADASKIDENDAKKKEAKKAAEIRAARRRLEQAEAEALNPAANIFTTRSYLIAALIIGGGIGFLVWRRRQRLLLLEATAVSRTPFNAPAASGAKAGTLFTADLLAKLEWKRFEELVAAYYSKTGVVAVRTKSGPAAPVHIKISWKGEPRPFALVQCISHPTGLVDAKPLQELHTVLSAEDIRRGYVVTTGKFNVPARDLAEEKHITLLPGDIFIEKLNALPDAARSEIMQAITTGDYTTPSCPKCEAKMVRSPDNPDVFRCTAHPDQQIAARK